MSLSFTVAREEKSYFFWFLGITGKHFRLATESNSGSAWKAIPGVHGKPFRECMESHSGSVFFGIFSHVFFLNDVGAMEDDYNNILSEDVSMDLDIGVGVSFVE